MEQDFIDAGHTNSYGALKVSDYLGSFLSEWYALQDRSGDGRYALREENLEIWNHQMQKRSLQQVVDLGVYLDALGIGDEFFEWEGVWIIEDGAVRYQTVGEDCFAHMWIGGSDLLINRNEGVLQIVDEVGFQALDEYICVR